MSENKQKPTTQSSPYLIPIAIIVAGGLVGAGLYFGGKHPPEADLGQQAAVQPPSEAGQEGQVAGSARGGSEEEVPQYETTVGDFLVLEDEICTEDGKPIVYYFGASGCPHCVWEHPIIQAVAAEFGDQISFHDLMDKQEEMEVFQKYIDINGGGIPFIVLGCKYVRVGSGERAGEEQEKRALTQLICELTGSQPSQTCQ